MTRYSIQKDKNNNKNKQNRMRFSSVATETERLSSCWDSLPNPMNISKETKHSACCSRNWHSGTIARATAATTETTIKRIINSKQSRQVNSLSIPVLNAATATKWVTRHWLLLLSVIMVAMVTAQADVSIISTTPINRYVNATHKQLTDETEIHHNLDAEIESTTDSTNYTNSNNNNGSSWNNHSYNPMPGSGTDSIFMRFAKRFSTGNELWDGIIRDCYYQPSFSCFQKNVYTFLNDALDAKDVNFTQHLRLYKNRVEFANEAAEQIEPTEATLAKDMSMESAEGLDMENADDEHLLNNEIPHMARAAPESPIEEVTNSLYGKSVKFAMTHDVEVKLPEVLFDGATFRISPRSMEGNGIIAKLELIPKQEVEARLAGKIIMKKIQKFLRSKVLMSLVALLLIIKIIKIKIFWLLPLIIGVGAAKKLLLKFLLFLFPALSHLFKLCSYYQQTYHSTKYHHHHHLINHHHTIVPQWHSAEHSSIPEIIYTNPPKGHVSTYLHGAPIHETYGPPPSFEHFEGGWENSGPGLGSEFISDINRGAQIEDNSNFFKPHNSDANELHGWGLGTTQSSLRTQTQAQLKQRLPATQQQRPPPQQKHQQQLHQPLNYQKPHATSHSFNPFLNSDNSIFTTKLKAQHTAQSAPSPVYTPPRNPSNVNANHANTRPPPPLPGQTGGLNAAQIAAQYNPLRNNPVTPQQQLSPELAAQLKEAIRIQAEQRIIAQQQKILDHQPFVQDGQPIMPKNYDPFYSPILMKIDKIVEQLGVTDDLCKERLVCSMYKDPTRYSPHSNFVSAELSRDTSELQPVTNPNEAVLRFYRLIQSARDGQEQKDCLRLYPNCNINTE